MILDPTELFARVGEKVTPKWNALIQFAQDHGISFGRGVKFRALPGGGIEVTGVIPPSPWIHAWKSGTPNSQGLVLLRKGLVNGHVPWITEELKMGDNDADGNPAKVQLEPKGEGTSWIAVGANVRGNDQENAELSAEPTFDELRLSEINELPRGFGTGGIIPDDEGWAWYPLVELNWKDQRVDRLFQIVVHNLTHVVVAAGENSDEERHFFPPV